MAHICFCLNAAAKHHCGTAFNHEAVKRAVHDGAKTPGQVRKIVAGTPKAQCGRCTPELQEAIKTARKTLPDPQETGPVGRLVHALIRR
jgi:bacterioferritin-associated ferredoxin